MSYIVGLTGGIGSGKSEVARRFAELGADVIDADAVSHRLTRPYAAGWTALKDGLGLGYFRVDAELDRTKLRHNVFKDPNLKATVEDLLHPLIAQEIECELRRWTHSYGILMVPLLLETGRYRDRIDRLLVVDCPEEIQVQRVEARSGLLESETRSIMAAQVSRAERLLAADDVIDNGGPLSALGAQIIALDRLYRNAAKRP